MAYDYGAWQGVNNPVAQIGTATNRITTEVYAPDPPPSPFLVGQPLPARLRYQNQVAPGVVADDLTDGVRLGGLRSVGELPYLHLYRPDVGTAPLAFCCFPWNDLVTPLYNAIPPEFLLVARGDGSALQYAADTSQPILFPRLPNNTFTPYTYCGTVDKDYQVGRGDPSTDRGER